MPDHIVGTLEGIDYDEKEEGEEEEGGSRNTRKWRSQVLGPW